MIELSLALGKTLEEIRQIPVSDYRLYQQFYEKQPFGLWRQDHNAALIAQAMRGGSMIDYMPFWTADDTEPDEHGQLDVLFAGAIEV